MMAADINQFAVLRHLSACILSNRGIALYTSQHSHFRLFYVIVTVGDALGLSSSEVKTAMGSCGCQLSAGGNATVYDIP